MSDVPSMNRVERTLYNLERTLIERRFRGLVPRAVSVVDTADFDGRAREPRLQLSAGRAAAGGQPLADMLTHLLIHYEMKDAGNVHWAGHGPAFTRRAAELGVFSDTLRSRCFALEDWLENPFLRSGRHAVHARTGDVVFGLARYYSEELHDFFLNERWLKGGHRFPDSLLPFVKFYSEELTDLLAVRATVARLTPRPA